MTERFDSIVIGAGQAGPALAGRLTAAGETVALVERALFGGTCVNTGCTPTKTLVASARAARLIARADEFGIVLPGRASVDFTRVMARKDAIVAESRAGIESFADGMERCTVIRGHARFEGPRAVRVGDRSLSAPKIFLNVGGRAAVPPMPGLDQVPVLTNSSLLALQELPSHLVVIGGSYVGLEFAQIFRRFGAEVTIVEKGSRLIAREDPATSDAVRSVLENEGIALRLDAECISFSPEGTRVCAHVDCTTGDRAVTGSHVLLAVGRRANTDDLGLDKAGVALDARGYVTVDDELRTSVSGIWALGECNGRGAFTHTAYNDFEIVAANLLDGESRRVTDRIDAYALYTDPPLGRVGMTEEQARRSGRRVLVGNRPMTRVARAREKGETQGFMSIAVDAESQEILGAAVLGPGGDEAVHGILDLMYAKAPYTTLGRATHIHPTVSELLPTIAGELAPLDDGRMGTAA